MIHRAVSGAEQRKAKLFNKPRSTNSWCNGIMKQQMGKYPAERNAT
jgi:hypothetical protein